MIDRSSFEAIRDLLYRIESALDDVEADLEESDRPTEVRAALSHLIDAVGDVRSISFEPRALGPDQ